MKNINYFQLGASLYTPATHKNLTHTVQNGISPAKSVVICTEDAVKESDLDYAIENLFLALSQVEQHKLTSNKLFIRPRNPDILQLILSHPKIALVDGFVLPKFDYRNIAVYSQIMQEHNHFMFMPTLETEEVFNQYQMHILADKLEKIRNQIICLRIGANDLLNLIGLKKV